MRRALRQHWPEAAAEALGLGLFMVSACAFAVLLEHRSSPLRAALPPSARRILMGLAMGLTAVGLVHSPWGRRSGAHLNPAVTLTFAALGKLRREVAVLYAVAQAAGGLAGVLLASAVLGPALADPSTRYALTQPGRGGPGAAFAAEVAISFGLMVAVLALSRSRFARYTGIAAGLLLWLFIAVEAPVSGTSMNPARSLGSALVAQDFRALWIYLVAPPLGMLGAAAALASGRARGCAKLDHSHPRCLFCGKGALP